MQIQLLPFLKLSFIHPIEDRQSAEGKHVADELVLADVVGIAVDELDLLDGRDMRTKAFFVLPYHIRLQAADRLPFVITF